MREKFILKNKLFFIIIILLLIGVTKVHAQEQASKDGLDSYVEQDYQNPYNEENASEIYELPAGEDHDLSSASIPPIDAETEKIFQTMTSLERESMLLKLQTENLKLKKEQENLQMDLKEIKHNQKMLEQDIENRETEDNNSSASAGSRSSSSSSSSRRRSSSSSRSSSSRNNNNEKQEEEKEEEKEKKVAEKYSFKTAEGVGGSFVVVLRDIVKQKDIKVKEGTLLSDGYRIIEITPESGVVFERDGEMQSIGFIN